MASLQASPMEVQNGGRKQEREVERVGKKGQRLKKGRKFKRICHKKLCIQREKSIGSHLLMNGRGEGK